MLKLILQNDGPLAGKEGSREGGGGGGLPSAAVEEEDAAARAERKREGEGTIDVL